LRPSQVPDAVGFYCRFTPPGLIGTKLGFCPLGEFSTSCSLVCSGWAQVLAPNLTFFASNFYLITDIRGFNHYFS